MRWLWCVGMALWVTACAQGSLAPEDMCDCPAPQMCAPDTGACVAPPLQDMSPDVPENTPDMPSPTCQPTCQTGQMCVQGQCVPPLGCQPVCDPATQMCVDGACVPRQPTGCTPECDVTQVCEQGACVPATCEPACDAPAMCTASGCVFPACQRAGDRCDPSILLQGSFHCLEKEGVARCQASCPEVGTGQGCLDGQLCAAPVAANPNVKVCIESECQNNADCTRGATLGTCWIPTNNHGQCQEAGAVGPGGGCNLELGPFCQQGSLCADGICARTCDPWAQSTGCGAGEFCQIYSARTGLCTQNIESVQRRVNDTCERPGAYCDDALQCLPTATESRCYKFCRAGQPGMGDCGEAGMTTLCDNYFRPGDREVGLCNPNCMLDSRICGSLRVCVAGLCRLPCPTGDAVADCCGGNTSCRWSCVQGYCE